MYYRRQNSKRRYRRDVTAPKKWHKYLDGQPSLFPRLKNRVRWNSGDFAWVWPKSSTCTLSSKNKIPEMEPAVARRLNTPPHPLDPFNSATESRWADGPTDTVARRSEKIWNFWYTLRLPSASGYVCCSAREARRKKLESKVLQARSGLMRAAQSSIADPKSKGIEISENARIVCPSIFRYFISS
jgi:hypothetical protein